MMKPASRLPAPPTASASTSTPGPWRQPKTRASAGSLSAYGFGPGGSAVAMGRRRASATSSTTTCSPRPTPPRAHATSSPPRLALHELQNGPGAEAPPPPHVAAAAPGTRLAPPTTFLRRGSGHLATSSAAGLADDVHSRRRRPSGGPAAKIPTPPTSVGRANPHIRPRPGRSSGSAAKDPMDLSPNQQRTPTTTPSKPHAEPQVLTPTQASDAERAFSPSTRRRRTTPPPPSPGPGPDSRGDPTAPTPLQASSESREDGETEELEEDEDEDDEDDEAQEHEHVGEDTVVDVHGGGPPPQSTHPSIDLDHRIHHNGPRTPPLSPQDLGTSQPQSPPSFKTVKRSSQAPKTPLGSSNYEPTEDGGLSATQRVRLSLSGYVTVASLTGATAKEKSIGKEDSSPIMGSGNGPYTAVNGSGIDRRTTERAAAREHDPPMSCPALSQSSMSKSFRDSQRNTALVASKLLPFKNSVDCLMGYIRELQQSEATLRLQLENIKRLKQDELSRSMVRVNTLESSIAQVESEREQERRILNEQQQLIEELSEEVSRLRQSAYHSAPLDSVPEAESYVDHSVQTEPPPSFAYVAAGDAEVQTDDVFALNGAVGHDSTADGRECASASWEPNPSPVNRREVAYDANIDEVPTPSTGHSDNLVSNWQTGYAARDHHEETPDDLSKPFAVAAPTVNHTEDYGGFTEGFTNNHPDTRGNQTSSNYPVISPCQASDILPEQVNGHTTGEEVKAFATLPSSANPSPSDFVESNLSASQKPLWDPLRRLSELYSPTKLRPPMFMLAPSETDIIAPLAQSSSSFACSGQFDLKPETSHALSHLQHSMPCGPPVHHNDPDPTSAELHLTNAACVDSDPSNDTTSHALVLDSLKSFDQQTEPADSRPPQALQDDQFDNSIASSPPSAPVFTPFHGLKLRGHKDVIEETKQESNVSLDRLLVEFFTAVDKNKLRMAEVYAKRYKGREQKLFSELSKRYGNASVEKLRAKFDGGLESEPPLPSLQRTQPRTPASPPAPVFEPLKSLSTPDSLPKLSYSPPAFAENKNTETFDSPPASRPFFMSAASFDGSSVFTQSQSVENLYVASPHERPTQPPPPLAPVSSPTTLADAAHPAKVTPTIRQHNLPLSCPPRSNTVVRSNTTAASSHPSQDRAPMTSPIGDAAPRPEVLLNPGFDLSAQSAHKLHTPPRRHPQPSQVPPQSPFPLTALPLSQSLSPPNSTPKASPSKVTLEGLLKEFYRKHQPDKLSNVPVVTRQYTGKERQLVELLRKKYGALSVKRLEDNLAQLELQGRLGHKSKSRGCCSLMSSIIARLLVAWSLVLCLCVVGLLGVSHWECNKVSTTPDSPEACVELDDQLSLFTIHELHHYTTQAHPVACYCARWKAYEDILLESPSFDRAVNVVKVVAFSRTIVEPIVEDYTNKYLSDVSWNGNDVKHALISVTNYASRCLTLATGATSEVQIAFDSWWASTSDHSASERLEEALTKVAKASKSLAAPHIEGGSIDEKPTPTFNAAATEDAIHGSSLNVVDQEFSDAYLTQAEDAHGVKPQDTSHEAPQVIVAPDVEQDDQVTVEVSLVQGGIELSYIEEAEHSVTANDSTLESSTEIDDSAPLDENTDIVSGGLTTDVLPSERATIDHSSEADPTNDDDSVVIHAVDSSADLSDPSVQVENVADAVEDQLDEGVDDPHDAFDLDLNNAKLLDEVVNSGASGSTNDASPQDLEPNETHKSLVSQEEPVSADADVGPDEREGKVDVVQLTDSADPPTDLHHRESVVEVEDVVEDQECNANGSVLQNDDQGHIAAEDLVGEMVDDVKVSEGLDVMVDEVQTPEEAAEATFGDASAGQDADEIRILEDNGVTRELLPSRQAEFDLGGDADDDILISAPIDALEPEHGSEESLSDPLEDIDLASVRALEHEVEQGAGSSMSTTESVDSEPSLIESVDGEPSLAELHAFDYDNGDLHTLEDPSGLDAHELLELADLAAAAELHTS